MVPATDENLARALKAATPANAWSEFLVHIENTCDAAEKDSSVPDGKGHAERIRRGIWLLRGMIRDGASKEALALEAIDLGQEWMALRVDVHAAAAVDAARRRIPKKTVSDAQIDAALKTEKTRQAAAAKLGISVRQISNRLKNRK
jgi:hypothetical protein